MTGKESVSHAIYLELDIILIAQSNFISLYNKQIP